VNKKELRIKNLIEVWT